MTLPAVSLRSLSLIALAAAVMGAALMAWRIVGVISFSEPLQFITSGGEHDSHFGVWKIVHGESVYVDRHRPPFAAFFFNWLFYESYGAVVRLFSDWMSLGDPWLPTIARLFTVSALFVGIGAAYASFREILARPGPAPSHAHAEQALALAFAVYLFAGPLIGFWGVTVRPDVWALVLEVCGISWLLRHYPDKRVSAVVGAAFFLYLAWSFKQTAVLAMGSAGLLLVIRRDWRMAFLFGAIIVIGWTGTLVIGGDAYRSSILLEGVPMFYTPERGLRNALNFAVKSLPSLLSVAGIVFVVLRSKSLRRRWPGSDPLMVGFIGMLLGFSLAGLGATQTGASENYYFTLSYFFCLSAVSGIALLGREFPEVPASVSAPAAAGWAAFALSIGLVMTGIVGVIDLRGQHAKYMDVKRCLDMAPRPLFVADPYLSLPWMTPGNTPWVLSYVYAPERAAGVSFDGDGIGGRIRDGVFKAIATRGKIRPKEIDGASLEAYRVVSVPCDDMILLVPGTAASPFFPSSHK